jgi:hypothetical protein
VAGNYANLTIVGVNGAQNSTVEGREGTHVYIDENSQTNLVIGKIEGFHPDEDPSLLKFTAITANGGYGDANGRFEIVRATADMVGTSTQFAVGDWVVVLKKGGSQDYDYESGLISERISFAVSPADGSGYTLKSEYATEFEFHIADVNEAPENLTIGGTLANGPDKIIVDEEVVGLEIGLLGAMDEDDVRNAPDALIHYSIVPDASNDWLHGQMFEITADGKLKLAPGVKLDWEQAPRRNIDGSERWYELVIRATDSGGYDAAGFPDPTSPPASHDTIVRIYVKDTNADVPNEPPNTIRLDGADAKTVAENSTVLGVMTAFDDNNAVASFAITDGDVDSLFEIVRNATSGEFELRVKDTKILDYEAIADAGKTYTLRVTATDQPGATSAEQVITLTVTDQNDAPSAPVWTPGVTIDENAQINDVVGTLTATDQDGDAVSFKFENASDAAGLISHDGAFRIEQAPGGGYRIVVNDPTKIVFTGGTSASFPYAVYATDGSVNSTSTVVDITVNEAPPIVAFAGASAPTITQFEGNPAPGDEYTDYTFNLVRTGDLNAASQVKWTLTGTNLTQEDVENGLFTGLIDFAINAGTATVTIRIKKDALPEGEETFTLTLEPADGGNGNAIIGNNNTGTLVVQDDDGVNNPPHSIVLIGGTTNTTATLEETIGGGRVVGTLSAQDDGGADNLTYSFAGGYASEALFQINANKQIVLNGALNFEELIATTNGAGLEEDGTGRFYRLLVRATDQGNPQLTADQEIRVYVTNVNEAPVIAATANPVTINETAANGDMLVAFTVTDPDLNETFVYEISGLPQGLEGAFAVDATDPTNLRIVVADTTLLDAFAGQTFDLTLTVRDQNGAQGAHLTDDHVFTVTINDVPPGNQAPTDIILSQDFVGEYSLNDVTIVGLLSAVDVGDLRGHRFELVDDAGGRFKLVGNATSGWQLVVANGTLIDYEQAPSHEISLIAYDADNVPSAVIKKVIAVQNMISEGVTGSPSGDTLKAAAGDDNIDGAEGNDVIYGGGGSDYLSGGGGADQFVFDAILDPTSTKYATIKDFNPNEDKIVLDHRVFADIVADGGVLSDFVFFRYAGADPVDDVQIIYDESTGSLLFDQDGTGDLPMILFAVLENAPLASTITNNHFIII